MTVWGNVGGPGILHQIFDVGNNNGDAHRGRRDARLGTDLARGPALGLSRLAASLQPPQESQD